MTDTQVAAAAMTDTDADAYIGVYPGWLRKNRNAPWAPPYMRYGVRTIRYRRVDLDAWMDEQRVSA